MQAPNSWTQSAVQPTRAWSMIKNRCPRRCKADSTKLIVSTQLRQLLNTLVTVTSHQQLLRESVYTYSFLCFLSCSCLGHKYVFLVPLSCPPHVATHHSNHRKQNKHHTHPRQKGFRKVPRSTMAPAAHPSVRPLLPLPAKVGGQLQLLRPGPSLP